MPDPASLTLFFVAAAAPLITPGSRLRGNRGLVRRQRWFTGGLYILLGLTAAFAGSGDRK